MTAAEALDRAETKRAGAQESAGKGRPAEAYSTMLEAWKLVDARPGDPGCRRLKVEIEEQLESLAERANAKFRDRTGEGRSEKTLIVK